MEFGKVFFLIEVSVGLGPLFSFDMCVCVRMCIYKLLHVFIQIHNTARAGPIQVPYAAVSEQLPIRKGSIPYFYNL